MSSVERELEALKFLDRLTSDLKRVQDPQHVVRYVLRGASELLSAQEACVAVAKDRRPEAQVLYALPKVSVWDLDLLARFIRVERPARPDDLLLAPIRRRSEAWAVMALSRPGQPYDRLDRRLLARIAEVTSDAVQMLDRERMLEIRDRIDRKIREQLHPKDLFYQILDGLRSLTRYDHSSALLIGVHAGESPGEHANRRTEDRGNTWLEIAAEQIAWTKAKSRRIGRRLVLGDRVRAALESGEVHGFSRPNGRWEEWNSAPLGFLAEWLEFADGQAPPESREHAMLCAPLSGRDGVFGVLKVAARRPGGLTKYDADLVNGFRSQAAQAIDSLTRAESLEARMATAERRHAMAELARGVSHDVNNALGSMLPLVQQMLRDAKRKAIDPALLEGDLEQVQASLQVCRRIFGGMLAFARGGVRRTRSGHIRTAIDTSLAILRTGIERRGVHLDVELPQDGELQPVACTQTDLEQVLLNLLTNAREASQPGGRILVGAHASEADVAIVISDTGEGIAAEHLSRVLEPFFTTRSDGNGLGLTICRSIVWEAGGTIAIDSTVGIGTRVVVTLPHASPQPATPAA
jgi:two-component system, NtrC family, sensor kinase